MHIVPVIADNIFIWARIRSTWQLIRQILPIVGSIFLIVRLIERGSFIMVSRPHMRILLPIVRFVEWRIVLVYVGPVVLNAAIPIVRSWVIFRDLLFHVYPVLLLSFLIGWMVVNWLILSEIVPIVSSILLIVGFVNWRELIIVIWPIFLHNLSVIASIIGWVLVFHVAPIVCSVINIVWLVSIRNRNFEERPVVTSMLKVVTYIRFFWVVVS